MFTRLLVNTNKIKKNCQIIKNIAKKYKYKHLIAVLKGNAYGHGVELIAPIVLKNGFDTIAVARVIEAIELRKKVKGKYNIIIIGMADYDEIELVKKYDLIIPITSFEYANNLVKKFKNKLNGLKIQFKLNTGMNRKGFKDAETLNKAFNLLKKYNCKIIGIYSHIYHNSDLIKVKKQFKLFEIIAEGVPN
jgi:alanine racemase